MPALVVFLDIQLRLVSKGSLIVSVFLYKVVVVAGEFNAVFLGVFITKCNLIMADV